jgi:glycosyltransferase involved in cell wall biosynthesis
MVPVSVVIPAHDEATVIGRGLRALQRDAEPGELEIVVVCNGCTDGTAAAARAAAPAATVLEIPVASKSAALNAGDAIATRFPRFYVDADVELGIAALREVAAVLAAGEALCAAPLPLFDVADRPPVVRRFYAVWQRMPFWSGPGVVGTGVYALSAAGRSRFAAFPAITADDQFVMERFATTERRTVRTARFTVHPPGTLDGLLAVRTRVYRGNVELREHHPPVEPPHHANGATLVTLLTRGRLADVATYVGVNVVAKHRARQPWDGRWERDESARRLTG